MTLRMTTLCVLALICAVPAQRRKGVKARQFYQLGIESFESGDYKEAVTALSKAISIDAKNAGALRLRGLSRIELGQPDLAIEDLSATLILNASQADAWLHRGNLYYEKSNLPYALRDYSQALERDPVDALPWHNRALVYQDMGKLDEALADFDSAVERDEKDPVLLYNRGFCRREYGNLEGALADLNAANAISKADPDLLVGRAELLIDTGDLLNAQRDLDAVLELRPKDVSAHAARARIRQSQGDHRGATADWQIELADNPSQGTYDERGQSLALLGRWKEAAVDFGHARSLGDREELALMQAVSHTAAGQHSEAATIFGTIPSQRAKQWAWFNRVVEDSQAVVPAANGDALFGYLSGQLNRKGLLAAVGKDAFLRAEALFFVAIKQGVDGDQETSMKTLDGIAGGDGVLRIQRAIVLEWMRRNSMATMHGDMGFESELRIPSAGPVSKGKTSTTPEWTVTSIRKGGAAELAGLELGDILGDQAQLLSGDGPFSGEDRAKCKPGEIIELSYRRGSQIVRTVILARLRKAAK